MRHVVTAATTILTLLVLTSPIHAQESPPAHEVEKQSNEGGANAGEGGLKTYELPEIVVTGHKALKEEQLIGPYVQPRWTATRRFPTTRVYVIPQGKFEFEWWTEYNVPRHDSTEVTYLYEFGMGLPYRLQLDLYQGFTNIERSFNFTQQSVEVRWAMADWGRIWGNPTWYYEYTTRDQDPNKQEIKLLLGDELAPRWHWGVNLVREWTVGNPDNRVEENGISAGLSYSLKDDVISVGMELKAARENSLLDTGEKKWMSTVKLGPSLMYRLTAAGSVEFAPLIGIGAQSERSQTWLVLSWEL
jgi:hypothetical protein